MRYRGYFGGSLSAATTIAGGPAAVSAKAQDQVCCKVQSAFGRRLSRRDLHETGGDAQLLPSITINH